jgi:hypothetical protein
VFVRKVRQKLEKASPDWRYIHTHFGVGYRFDPERRGGPGEEDSPPASPPEEPVERTETPHEAGSEPSAARLTAA